MSFELGTAIDYSDLLEKLNTFLTAKGSAFGLGYAGTGNGTLTDYRGGASSVAETFTITATSPTSFTVVGSVSGSIGPATVGTPFVHAKIEFTLTAGGTAFVAGDVFMLSTAPKWTSLVQARGCRVTATQGTTGMNAAQNLVDGKSAGLPAGTNSWRADSPITFPQDVVFEFLGGVSQTVSAYHLIAGGITTNAPRDWTFDYWDGAGWVTLDTQAGITSWGTNEVKQFPIAAPQAATKVRLHITASQYSNYVGLSAVRLIRQTGVNVNCEFSHRAWQAPGNDGVSAIYVGVHPFERQDADYFNWEICGLDGWTAGTRFYEQAGFHGKLYLPLWNASIPYWFVADGRSCVVVAKVNTQYELAILGLDDSYLSPAQRPYPLVLGGTMAHGPTLPAWYLTSWRWSNASNRHRMPTHADTYDGSGTPPPPEWSQLRARMVEGTWSGFEGTYNDGFSATPTSRPILWPYRCGLTLLDPDPNGTYSLYPVELNHHAPNTLGKLPRIFCVTGQGLSAETLIRVGQIDHLVLPNINRTDREDFLAVALD